MGRICAASIRLRRLLVPCERSFLEQSVLPTKPREKRTLASFSASSFSVASRSASPHTLQVLMLGSGKRAASLCTRFGPTESPPISFTNALGSRASSTTFACVRTLCWVGHVARMDKTRLPRRLLTAWVANSRPIGGIEMTYGRSLERWSKLAQDRPKWRALITAT